MRVDAAEILKKLFWGGGAVSLATSSADFHVLKCRPADKLEDGTVNFLDIVSLKVGAGICGRVIVYAVEPQVQLQLEDGTVTFLTSCCSRWVHTYVMLSPAFRLLLPLLFTAWLWHYRGARGHPLHRGACGHSHSPTHLLLLLLPLFLTARLWHD